MPARNSGDFALVFLLQTFRQTSTLRCPCRETFPMISHENANFLFSVFRVVQGEAKTPKTMPGCCRANFAFLHALMIGTFRRWKMNIRNECSKRHISFAWLLIFLINRKLAFSQSDCFSTMHASGNCKNVGCGAQNRAKNDFLPVYDWKPIFILA